MAVKRLSLPAPPCIPSVLEDLSSDDSTSNSPAPSSSQRSSEGDLNSTTFRDVCVTDGSGGDGGGEGHEVTEGDGRLRIAECDSSESYSDSVNSPTSTEDTDSQKNDTKSAISLKAKLKQNILRRRSDLIATSFDDKTPEPAEPTPQDNERKEALRERNRDAARKSRLKKTATVQTLNRETEKLMSEQTAKKYEVYTLQKEKEMLQQLLSEHLKTCTMPLDKTPSLPEKPQTPS